MQTSKRAAQIPLPFATASLGLCLSYLFPAFLSPVTASIFGFAVGLVALCFSPPGRSLDVESMAVVHARPGLRFEDAPIEGGTFPYRKIPYYDYDYPILSKGLAKIFLDPSLSVDPVKALNPTADPLRKPKVETPFSGEIGGRRK